MTMKEMIDFEKHEYFSQGFFKNGEPMPGVQYQEDPYWNYQHSLISIEQEMEISRKLEDGMYLDFCHLKHFNDNHVEIICHALNNELFEERDIENYKDRLLNYLYWHMYLIGNFKVGCEILYTLCEKYNMTIEEAAGWGRQYVSYPSTKVILEKFQDIMDKRARFLDLRKLQGKMAEKLMPKNPTMCSETKPICNKI